MTKEKLEEVAQDICNQENPSNELQDRRLELSIEDHT
jgi:hypothetical protein